MTPKTGYCITIRCARVWSPRKRSTYALGLSLSLGMLRRLLAHAPPFQKPSGQVHTSYASDAKLVGTQMHRELVADRVGVHLNAAAGQTADSGGNDAASC